MRAAEPRGLSSTQVSSELWERRRRDALSSLYAAARRMSPSKWRCRRPSTQEPVATVE